MVTHNLKLCKEADIIYLLDQGKLKNLENMKIWLKTNYF